MGQTKEAPLPKEGFPPTSARSSTSTSTSTSTTTSTTTSTSSPPSSYHPNGSPASSTPSSDALASFSAIKQSSLQHQGQQEPLLSSAAAISKNLSSQSQVTFASVAPSEASTQTPTPASTSSLSKLTLSDYQEMRPVSEQDWIRWVRGEGLGSGSPGIKGLKGVKDRDAQFWNTHGYLPPPSKPQSLKRKHTEVLRRHGFEDPESLIPILGRSTRLAKSHFNIEYAAFTIASNCSNPDQVLVFGGFQDDIYTPLDRTGSACSHALLGEQVGPATPEVFHLPDMDKDYRFARNPNLCSLDGNRRLRFYISVPLCLPSGNGNGGEEMIAVGRFCLISEHTRSWSEEESSLLKDLCSMTSEAIQKNREKARGLRMAVIQRSLTFLTRSVDEPALLDHSQCIGPSCNPDLSQGPGAQRFAVTSDGYHYCPRRVEVACDSIQTVIGASSCLAIDVSDFRTSLPISNKLPSSSSSIPWNLNGSPTSPRQTTMTEEPASNRFDRRSSLSISNSSGFRLNSRSTFLNEETEVCPVPSSGPHLISGAGKGIHIPTLASEFGSSELQREEVSSWLGRWKLEERKSLSILYDNSPSVSNLEKEEEEETETSRRNHSDFNNDETSRNPLVSLLPDSKVDQYLAIPIFNLNEQPMLVILVSFEEKRAIEPECLLFVENVGNLIRSSIMRQQIKAAEAATLYFIQQIQHEFRTPLHAIFGLAELLQQSASCPGPDAPIDISDSQALSALLSGIQLAGHNLDTILEGVLDFSRASEGRETLDTLNEVPETINLSSMLEHLGSASLEHLHLTSSVGEGNTVQEMKMSLLDINKSFKLPSLTISIDPELARNSISVRSPSKVEKVLSHIISNAVKFAAPEGIIEISVRSVSSDSGESLLEFTVRDNGPGMSRSFVENELMKAFRKENFHRQGVGLGFSLAVNLCQAIGADLRVDSKLEVGTTVTFTVSCQEQINEERIEIASTSKAKKVAFVGFKSESWEKVKDFFLVNLSEDGIELCEPEAAEVLFCSEDVVERPSCSRVIIVLPSLGSSTSSIVNETSITTFRLPYGPSLLKEIKDHLNTEPLLNPSTRSLPSIPAKEKQAIADTTPAAVTDDSSSDPETDIFRVLIVEDNPLNLRLLATVCNKMNIKIETAEDGAQAVIKFVEFKPSLVLLDINLPILDGFAACTQMRGHILDHLPKIVAITALSSPSDKTRGSDVGINLWLTKPVGMRKLRQDLEAWRKAWKERKVGDSNHVW